jgi:hypothetical protein
VKVVGQLSWEHFIRIRQLDLPALPDGHASLKAEIFSADTDLHHTRQANYQSSSIGLAGCASSYTFVLGRTDYAIEE